MARNEPTLVYAIKNTARTATSAKIYGLGFLLRNGIEQRFRRKRKWPVISFDGCYFRNRYPASGSTNFAGFAATRALAVTIAAWRSIRPWFARAGVGVVWILLIFLRILCAVVFADNNCNVCTY
jgi:hypothetical protein